MSFSELRSTTCELNEAGVACVMRLVATVPVTMPRRLAASRTVPHGRSWGSTVHARESVERQAEGATAVR